MGQLKTNGHIINIGYMASVPRGKKKHPHIETLAFKVNYVSVENNQMSKWDKHPSTN